MKSSEHALFGGILAIAIIGAFILGIINDRFVARDLSDDAGLMAYARTASNLIHRLSFHSEDVLFEEAIRRPPGYPILIAFSFLVFGEHLWAIWILHILFFLASITFLWRISARFLEKKRALLTPLFFVGWWGSLTQVFIVNVEIAAWVLLLGAFWSFIRYYEKQQMRFAFGFSGAFAWFVLIKPVFLYAFPVLMVFLIWQNRPFSKALFRHAIAAVALFALFVGSWSFYSYQTIGTFQLASGGLTVMRRADDVRMPSERLLPFLIASVMGDRIANKVFPGYAENPEPLSRETRAREKRYFERLAPDKSNEAALQREMIAEASSLIKQSPIKFALTGFIYTFRIHMPLLPSGAEVGGTQKIIPLLALLSAWYAFLVIVAVNIARHAREGGLWYPICFFIAYTIGMYALFSHAEPRYLFPVMPFYFLLFATFLIEIKTIAHRVVLDSMTESRGSRVPSPTTRDFSHTIQRCGRALLQTHARCENYAIV